MNLSSTKTFGFSVLLFGLLLCGTGIWLLLSPAQYRATVRIKVLNDFSDAEDYYKNHPMVPSYDPYFVTPVFEGIQSPLVLSNVVETLNLDVEWGRRFGDGKPLVIKTTINRLQKRISLKLIPNSIITEISFCGDDPNEAARIANAIAKSYYNFRIERWKQITKKGIQTLAELYQKEEEQIRSLQTNVDFLREKFKINKDDEFDFDHANTLSQELAISPEERDQRQKEYERTKPFWDEKRKLNNLTDFHKLLAARIKAEESDIQTPRTSTVQIVEVAEPPKLPVSPNRWLGATLLVIGLFPTVGGFLLLKSSPRLNCSGGLREMFRRLSD